MGLKDVFKFHLPFLLLEVHLLRLIEPPVNIFLRLMGSNYPGTK